MAQRLNYQKLHRHALVVSRGTESRGVLTSPDEYPVLPGCTVYPHVIDDVEKIVNALKGAELVANEREFVQQMSDKIERYGYHSALSRRQLGWINSLKKKYLP